MAKASLINRLKQFGKSHKKKLLAAAVYGALAAKPLKETVQGGIKLNQILSGQKPLVGGKMKKIKRSKSSKKKSKSNSNNYKSGGACHPMYTQCGGVRRGVRRGGKLIIRRPTLSVI